MYNRLHVAVATALFIESFASLPASAQTVLYSQSVVTHAGQGSGGLDFSMTSSDTGLTSTGFNVTNGYRLVSDFVLGPGSTVSSIVFQAYQTNSSSVTSPFNGIDAKIWTGRPGDAGSTLVFSSTTLGSNTFANLYRGTTLSATSRPVFNVEALFPSVALSAGTYWLDVAISTTNGNNAFAPFIAGPVAASPTQQYDPNALSWADLVGGTGNSKQAEFGFQVKGASAVPEPGEWAAMGILGAGLTGLVLRKRHKA